MDKAIVKVTDHSEGLANGSWMRAIKNVIEMFNYKSFIMSRFFLCICCFGCIHFSIAQKPVIDSTAIVTWPTLAGSGISADGQYVYYSVKDPIVKKSSFVIESADGNWKKTIWSGGVICFSANSRELIYQLKDSLAFLTLGSDRTTFVSNISGTGQAMEANDKWLAWQLKADSTKTLFLRDLTSGNERKFEGVTAYQFDLSGKVLLLQIVSDNDSATAKKLVWVSLGDWNIKTIAVASSDTVFSGFSFDKDLLQLAFIKKPGSAGEGAVWYYKVGMDKALFKADNHSPGIPAGWLLRTGYIQFTPDARYLQCTLEQPEYRKADPKAVSVDVWSYTDEIIQSQQLKSLGPQTTSGYINIDNGQIVRLPLKGNKVMIGGTVEEPIIYDEVDYLSNYWLMDQENRLSLLSTSTGTRKILSTGVLGAFKISPDTRWLVWFDFKKPYHYFSYDTQTHEVRDISKNVPYQLDNTEREPAVHHGPFGDPIWCDDASRLLVYDRYDIWAIDPAGIIRPVNVTNGYGRRHHIRLRILNQSQKPLSLNEPLLLTAQNQDNLFNGLYVVTPSAKKDPQPKLECIPDKINFTSSADGSTWIVEKQSASEAPNYFITKDFIQFRQLTHLDPQRNYNWLTAELIPFTQLDGIPSRGILYRPADFDPHKRYPVIFNYYEIKSDGLFDFIRPMTAGENINIPWFVSRGYLVFTPDIHYIISQPGKSAYNSVVAAARMLSQKPWVDSTKMGIEGHSFGGFETNYIVTHTNMFRAACSVSGFVSWISWYGSLTGDGNWWGHHTEQGQGRFAGTLWQKQKEYLENSPILYADKVTTPLLLMANKNDGLVAYSEGQALFIALRRLNKKAWMLQYKVGGHGVTSNEARDFTTRVTQFFDHYLKGALAPRWMTEGIPARLKGIDLGLELDKSGKMP